MTARMPCRSSSSNAANTLTKVNIRIQFLLVYGKWNRMSLISGFRVGFLDFALDFWISRWISGFHVGFLDFVWISRFLKVLDFWISLWISDFWLDFYRRCTRFQACRTPRR